MTQRRITPWTDYFYRAEKESIGIILLLDSPPDNTLVYDVQSSRPATGFDDYTVALPSLPNAIMIVKPGVTLDD